MAIKQILRIGNPILRQATESITAFDTPDLHNLIQDMKDTMEANNGAGLAAIQIGITKQVMIFGIEKNPRYPDVETIPSTTIINPKYEVLNKEKEDDWEGCLSVPGMRGLVPRYKHIRYYGFDEFGAVIEREVTNFHARVFQHEFDHLEGVLYPDKIEKKNCFGFIEELDNSGAFY
tara:strand:- start:2955 stop:3482 length:528 start_codon:yes stop_codon:yes gene_type:complete